MCKRGPGETLRGAGGQIAEGAAPWPVRWTSIKKSLQGVYWQWYIDLYIYIYIHTYNVYIYIYIHTIDLSAVISEILPCCCVWREQAAGVPVQWEDCPTLIQMKVSAEDTSRMIIHRERHLAQGIYFLLCSTCSNSRCLQIWMLRLPAARPTRAVSSRIHPRSSRYHKLRLYVLGTTCLRGQALQKRCMTVIQSFSQETK